MEKLIAYCQVYLYFASGFIGIYLFGDIIGLAVFGSIISMGIVHYFCILEDKRFPLVKSIFYFYSSSLIMANLGYLPFENGIFEYKAFSERLCFSLWFSIPPLVIDLFRKKNWE